jgi:hypothetical protein
MQHSLKGFFKGFLPILSLLFCLNTTNFSQAIAVWEFDSQTAATTTPTNGTVTDATWSTGTVTYPAGNSAVATDKAISTTGFNSTAINTAKYLQFTITPNASYAMALNSISFFDTKSATGPSSWVLRSSLDAYATNINGAIGVPGTAFTATPQSIELGLDFQNITTGITFRLYGYGASSAAGTWRLDDLTMDGSLYNVSNPVLVSSKSAISYTTISIGSPSVSKSFIASGFGLTGDLTVTAAAGYEISLTEPSGYTSSLSFPQIGGRVTSKVIYERLIGSTAGNFNGNTTLTSPSVPTKNIVMNGSVINQPTRTNIAAVRSKSTGTNIFTGGRVTAATEFGPNQIFVQDNSGGISVYSSAVNFGVDYSLQIGDSVEIFGYKSVFNNLDQITMLTFTKISTPQYITPALVIQQSELAAHEGELVTIQNVAFPGSGGNYTANTNYAFGLLPVRILSAGTPSSNNIVGSAIQSATGNVTGISGVYGTSLQLYPRSTADFVVTGVGVTDATFQDASALDIVAWNLNWFSSPTNGPTDDALQINNVKTVMNTLNADIYQFEEVSDSVAFKSMVASLGGYSCKCSFEYSYSNSPIGDIYGQRLCFAYKDAVFSNVNAKPLLTEFKHDITLLPDYPNTSSRFWASGRLPYMLTANVTINGTTRYMGFLGIHARANTSANVAQEVYDMRTYDLNKLKTVLDANYPDLPYIMSGDFNDDLDETVANVTTTVSTYNAFINDPSRYSLFTLALSNAGAKSTTGFTDMIDHIIGSNEMSSAFMTARVGTPQNYIASYGTKTTDHYPVMAKFNLQNVPVFVPIPVELLSFNAKLMGNEYVKLDWTTATERNSAFFDVEKSTDGQAFKSINQVKAAGQSSQKLDYSYDDKSVSEGNILYYRLKQVDTDGQFKYSHTVSILKKDKNMALVVYPNPAQNMLFIEGIEAIKSIKIYTSQGVLLHQSNQKTVSISDFSAGIYILEAENTEGGIARTKFVKE